MQKITRGLPLVALLALSSTVVAQTDPVEEYSALLRQIEGLQAYNALLERQVATQARQLAELQVAIGEVPELERQVPALIVRMVDGLEQFVSLDLPFQQTEREDRVATMRNLVESAAVNDAEKFRRVLEAWEIENEYGRAVTSYTGSIDVGGVAKDVDFLQLGRIALLYQTQDLASVGVWDVTQNGFVELGTEYRNPIRQALRMAQASVAPDITLLPVSAPSDN